MLAGTSASREWALGVIASLARGCNLNLIVLITRLHQQFSPPCLFSAVTQGDFCCSTLDSEQHIHMCQLRPHDSQHRDASNAGVTSHGRGAIRVIKHPAAGQVSAHVGATSSFFLSVVDSSLICEALVDPHIHDNRGKLDALAQTGRKSYDKI